MLKEATEETYDLEEHFLFISLRAAKIRIVIKDKEEILNFVNSEEFLCLFEQGRHHEFCERYDIK